MFSVIKMSKKAIARLGGGKKVKVTPRGSSARDGKSVRIATEEVEKNCFMQSSSSFFVPSASDMSLAEQTFPCETQKWNPTFAWGAMKKVKVVEVVESTVQAGMVQSISFGAIVFGSLSSIYGIEDEEEEIAYEIKSLPIIQEESVTTVIAPVAEEIAVIEEEAIVEIETPAELIARFELPDLIIMNRYIHSIKEEIEDGRPLRPTGRPGRIGVQQIIKDYEESERIKMERKRIMKARMKDGKVWWMQEGANRI
jgi:hypothetical protein